MGTSQIDLIPLRQRQWGATDSERVRHPAVGAPVIGREEMTPNPARALSLAVSFAGLAAAHLAAAVAQGLDLRVRQGYDTNIYEIATASDSVRVEGHYSLVRAAYEYETPGPAFSFFLRPEGRVKWYPQSSGANQYGGDVELGFESNWRNPRRGARWLRRTRTRLEVVGAYERALFLKRQTREEFRSGEEIDRTLAVTDLPSRASAEGELNFRADLTRDLRVETAALAEWTDYTDASAATVRSFDRLDARTVGALVELAVDLPAGWELSGQVRFRDRVYPRREARTAGGESVDGTHRHYWLWDFEGRAEVRSGLFRNELELGFGRRSDRFEGYHSYDEWEAGDRLRLNLGHGWDVELRYSYGRRAYDLFAPAGAPTLNHYHDARALFSVEFAPGFRLAFGSEYERTLSNDPLFDFERLDAFGEIRVGR